MRKCLEMTNKIESQTKRERERKRARALVCDISGFGCEREAGTLGVCK